MSEEKTDFHLATSGDEPVFADDDEAELAPTDRTEEGEGQAQNGWKVLIVDDETHIHNTTKSALRRFAFEGKALNFISAYSGEEAKALIQKHPDTALILLDVVMETGDAGLEVAKYIRQELKNQLVRIVLRTGQPGQAPEDQIIVDYDINDYKAKIELTSEKLFTTILGALRSFRDLANIEASRKELQQLVEATQRFVPYEFLSFLEKQSIVDVRLGDLVQERMTILLSDIRAFTTLSEQMTPEENFAFINSYLSRMAPLIKEHNGFIDKYLGDAIRALFPNSADDAVRASLAMQHQLVEYNQGRRRADYQPVQFGISIHTGDLILGTVGGQDRMDGTVISDAIDVVTHLENLTKLYGTSLLISGETYSRLGAPEQYAVRNIDRVKVEGKSDPVAIYEVFDSAPPHIMDLKMKTLEDFEQGLVHYRQQRFVEAKQLFNKVLQTNNQDTVASVYLGRCEEFQKDGAPDDWDGTVTADQK